MARQKLQSINRPNLMMVASNFVSKIARTSFLDSKMMKGCMHSHRRCAKSRTSARRVRHIEKDECYVTLGVAEHHHLILFLAMTP
jgi:hypothetical protein